MQTNLISLIELIMVNKPDMLLDISHSGESLRFAQTVKSVNGCNKSKVLSIKAGGPWWKRNPKHVVLAHYPGRALEIETIQLVYKIAAHYSKIMVVLSSKSKYLGHEIEKYSPLLGHRQVLAIL